MNKCEHITNMYEFIKKKTEEKGKSLYWLSKQIGVQRQQIYHIAHQKDITLSLAIKIADALGISLDEFRKEV